MLIEFLGSGTSTGVPMINCKCEVCHSTDPRDKRLRQSVIVHTKGKHILIDCGPDFRYQMLRSGTKHLDALLLTHSHYDHVGGIDDIRPYCKTKNPFPIYCRADVITDLENRIPYCFSKHPYPGVPSLKLIEIGDDEFSVEGIPVQPLRVWHDKLLINGYRIGNMAYITDASKVEEQVIESLHGIPYLIINALRFIPHHSHMTLDESLAVISRIQPGEAYLIHFSDGIGLHAVTSKRLPPNVFMSYDGLKIPLKSGL